MTRLVPLVLAILVVAAGFVLFSSMFTVHQTSQAMVLQFGNPIRVVNQPGQNEPGLHFKLPWQNVIDYDKRVLNLDPPVARVILSDQKPLLVDVFARYRIDDPLLFFQRVRSESGVRQRLGPIINAALRSVLGNVNLVAVLSEERGDIMRQILARANDPAITEGEAAGSEFGAKDFGIELVDVRIRRADLPDETRQAVYARMKSEREREAAEARAQGFEQSQRIKATADREATVIRAEAEREAEILRGQGEGKRTEILNSAYGQNQDFFSFYRSMQAYEASLANERTFMVLSPDSDFFRFFDEAGSKAKGN